MDIETLLIRLRKAKETRSFRELGAICKVSNETIRGILRARSGELSVTLKTFSNIDNGLKEHGL